MPDMTYIPGGSEPRREPLGPTAYTAPAWRGSEPFNNQTGQPLYPPLTPPLPPKKRRTGLIAALSVAAAVIAAGAVVLVLALTGHSPVSVPGVSHGFRVRGMLTVGDCDSIGYNDIRAGTEVTITDESGKVLAVGQLNGGAAHCNFPFVINNVPPGEKFYGVTISHRGTLHYTEAQMRQDLQLTLG